MTVIVMAHLKMRGRSTNREIGTKDVSSGTYSLSYVFFNFYHYKNNYVIYSFSVRKSFILKYIFSAT